MVEKWKKLERKLLPFAMQFKTQANSHVKDTKTSNPEL